ncbi:hypothetical protein V1294_002359 [Bradyrhizobium sp. AZCC 1678]
MREPPRRNNSPCDEAILRLRRQMVQKRAQLSDGCKAVFQYAPAAAATPVNYAPAAKPSRPLNLTPHKRG